MGTAVLNGPGSRSPFIAALARKVAATQIPIENVRNRRRMPGRSGAQTTWTARERNRSGIQGRPGRETALRYGLLVAIQEFKAGPGALSPEPKIELALANT